MEIIIKTFLSVRSHLISISQKNQIALRAFPLRRRQRHQKNFSISSVQIDFNIKRKNDLRGKTRMKKRRRKNPRMKSGLQTSNYTSNYLKNEMEIKLVMPFDILIRRIRRHPHMGKRDIPDIFSCGRNPPRSLGTTGDPSLKPWWKNKIDIRRKEEKPLKIESFLLYAI